MLTVLLRGVILYAVVICMARLMGKRQLGELSPAELVITILISNIATLCMEDIDLPLITGLVPILVLVCIDVIIGFLSLKIRPLRQAISGSPKIIISNGVLDQGALRQLRFSVDDILCSMRALGIFDISQVQYAVVETTGSVSVLLKNEYLPITKDSVSNPKASCDPPKVIISDGEILDKEAVKRLGLDAKRIFLCCEETGGKVTVIYKEEK